MTRNEAREIMMQIMYEMDASKDITKETATSLIEERLSGNHINRGKAIILGVIDDMENIDETINANSKSWKTGRMPKVDLAILRLSVGEMNYGEDVPAPVVINEAINLAKKYSTEQSYRFIHGLLGSIAKNNEK